MTKFKVVEKFIYNPSNPSLCKNFIEYIGKEVVSTQAKFNPFEQYLKSSYVYWIDILGAWIGEEDLEQIK